MAALAREFDEALVEAQVVPDGVLPPLRLEVLVVGELGLDEVVDVAQLQLSLLALLYAHGDHGNVAEGRLHIGICNFMKLDQILMVMTTSYSPEC